MVMVMMVMRLMGIAVKVDDDDVIFVIVTKIAQPRETQTGGKRRGQAGLRNNETDEEVFADCVFLSYLYIRPLKYSFSFSSIFTQILLRLSYILQGLQNGSSLSNLDSCLFYSLFSFLFFRFFLLFLFNRVYTTLHVCTLVRRFDCNIIGI